MIKCRLESEKARGLATQLDRVREEKSLMQSDLSVQASEIALLKANEKRMMRDGSDYREKVILHLIAKFIKDYKFINQIMFQAKSLEEELYKLKASRSVEDLQKKELEEQLEAEQYFSTLYKTQVGKLHRCIFGGQILNPVLFP